MALRRNLVLRLCVSLHLCRPSWAASFACDNRDIMSHFIAIAAGEVVFINGDGELTSLRGEGCDYEHEQPDPNPSTGGDPVHKCFNVFHPGPHRRMKQKPRPAFTGRGTAVDLRLPTAVESS